MSDNEEYEVESVTRARVHDKKGKKLTWKYYVKWKGYSWDENTWEPAEHFSQSSQNFLQDFWKRVDTGGRDISDATAFRKGEEIFLTGPPSKAGLKRRRSAVQIKQPPFPDQEESVNAVISDSPSSARKRRKVRKPDDVPDTTSPKRQARSPRSKRRVSMGTLKGVKESLKRVKRRRASSPGPRIVASRRILSVTNSDLDAEGEVDPDAEGVTKEIEDALMHPSTDDEDDGPSPKGAAIARDVSDFGDLQHFYNSQPIEIERVLSVEAQSGEPGSPAPSSPDPLFDSPSHSKDDGRQRSRESSIPFHRARAAKPRVILMDTPVSETSSTAITAKARLMSHPGSNTSDAAQVRMTAKRGGKSGTVRPSTSRNRSSLLTASRGKLTTVKGKFTPTDVAHDQPDEIEEVPTVSNSGDTPLAITTWIDEDAVMETGEGDHTSGASAIQKPPGSEIPSPAGMEMDELPDFEDELSAQEKPLENSQDQQMAEHKEGEQTPAPGVDGATSQATQASLDLAATQPPASSLMVTESDSTNIATNVVATLAEDIMKKNIALAKEQLFPSAQASFSSFSEAPISSSFRSTIFGPLYQGASPSHASNGENDNGSSTSFKIIISDTVSIPLTLKDSTDTQGRMSDLKPGLFYGLNDALAIVNTLHSFGPAQAVPVPTASEEERGHLAALVQRLGSNQMCVAPVGKDVYVLCSSENTAVAERLSTPAHLVGSSDILLVSRATIENQLTYVAAVYGAKPELL